MEGEGPGRVARVFGSRCLFPICFILYAAALFSSSGKKYQDNYNANY
jgi:hypothetical protein